MKKWSFAILPFLFLAMSSHKDDPPVEHEITDGPYITYSDSRMYINYIIKDGDTLARKVDSMDIDKRSGYVVKVSTEVPGKMFDVKLKAKLQEERSVWGKPKKALVISDIEGNFGAFRKLLVANKVIDENFNWTFDDGHVLFVGDFVDRGQHQMEVLWLIYSLEDKAKAAGGYVHYVLGNHEIMNLSGDLRYLDPKYFKAAQLMNKQYVELIGDKTEIGRWLRTKNVAEKIGDVLYVHGGISPLVYRIPFDVPMINKLARPFYADSTYAYPNLETDILFGDGGPFWYRGFYSNRGNPAVELQVDSSLERFSSNHIVTGHTIVADTISMWFNGKVFNTDTHHAKGHSEALLIEGGDKFYRVDANGNKNFMIKK
jgi:diadenosine tetraphosphatase ApaH/serine/threonine PP2A family protein phosphatase